VSTTSQFSVLHDAPPRRVSDRSHSRIAVAVWLLQLVFPAIGLGYVLLWSIDPYSLGNTGLILFSASVLWFGFCLTFLRMPRAKAWITRHSLLLLVLYFLFGAGVVAAELFARSMPEINYDPRSPHITQLSAQLGWSLAPGKRDIGSNGWRKPTYPREKPAGHCRILCFGDSRTFCLGNTWNNAWPHQLEEVLNRDPQWTSTHGPTEVLNCGVLMYGPDQSLIDLRDSGQQYAPDVVIFHLSLEHFADVSFDHNWRMYYNTMQYKPFFTLKDGQLKLGRDYIPLPTDAAGNVALSSNQILPELNLALFGLLRSNAARSWITGQMHDEPAPPKQVCWPIHDSYGKEYARARPLVWAILKEMARVSAEAGATFCVTLAPRHMRSADDKPPWRNASFLREYHEDAKAHGIKAYDCLTQYFAEGGDGRFRLQREPFDLNSEGNAFIADATGRWLKDAVPPARP
jgi:lysophospholipase L1-like esterase